MANITAKTVWDGAEFELSDVELSEVTNRTVIDQMISGGIIKPESELPKAADGTETFYSIIDKAGVKVDPDVNKPLADFGFTDGDTVRIIQRGGGASL